jgi:MtN3 and saliva related transmembrane protein
MSAIELLGYAAACASGGAFLPQAVRAFKSRSTGDLSLLSVALAFLGTVLWGLYGLAIESAPVVASNVIVMPFALTTLILKITSLSHLRRAET